MIHDRLRQYLIALTYTHACDDLLIHIFDHIKIIGKGFVCIHFGDNDSVNT